MKVSGKHFKRGMKDNSVIIKSNFIAIHSSDGDTGVFRKVVNELSSDSDENLNFNLSSKDFSLVSKFNDLKIGLTGETISFKSNSSTFKIQNYDHNFTSPAKEGRKDLNIPIDILEKASKFTDTSRAEAAGILVYPNCVIGSSGPTLYKFKIKTGDSFIHIPLNFLKVMDGKDYQLTATDKFVFASKDGEIAYSALYEQKIAKLDEYDPKLPGSIKCNLNELKEHISVAEYFGKYVFIDISKDKMTIQSIIDEGQNKNFNATLSLQSSNIESYRKAFIVSNLLKVLNAVDTKEIGIDNRYIVLRNKEELVMTMVYTQPGETELVLKKEEEN
ncbi:MAG: hypothetical protein RR945_02015 [Erysipelotrichaceae bacterium]